MLLSRTVISASSCRAEPPRPQGFSSLTALQNWERLLLILMMTNSYPMWGNVAHASSWPSTPTASPHGPPRLKGLHPSPVTPWCCPGTAGDTECSELTRRAWKRQHPCLYLGIQGRSEVAVKGCVCINYVTLGLGSKEVTGESSTKRARFVSYFPWFQLQ